MTKLVKEIALTFSISDVEFRNLAEMHKLCAGDDRTKKVVPVLAGPPYNIGRNEYDDHADYDVLGSNDFKDLAKVPKDVIRPEGYAQVLCYALQFSLCY